MRELNIDFLELYKKVDRFIRDAYGSEDGVSEYIRQMEDSYFGAMYVSSWKIDHDMLKRLRWIRNKLSHEIDFDAEILKKTDYEWLKEFSTRLHSVNDPLAAMNRAKEAERLKAEERRRHLEEQQRRQLLLQEQQLASTTDTESDQIPYWVPKIIVFQQSNQEARQPTKQKQSQPSKPRESQISNLRESQPSKPMQYQPSKPMQYQPSKQKSLWKRIKDFFFGG